MDVGHGLTAAADGLCRLLGIESNALVAACAGLTGILLTLIVLGFGPLRGWLGPRAAPAAIDGTRAGRRGQRRDSEAAPGPVEHLGAGAFDVGIVGLWRLYRQLRRVATAERARGVPALDVPAGGMTSPHWATQTPQTT